jgi:hypothetical protein
MIAAILLKKSPPRAGFFFWIKKSVAINRDQLP